MSLTVIFYLSCLASLSNWALTLRRSPLLQNSAFNDAPPPFNEGFGELSQRHLALQTPGNEERHALESSFPTFQ